MAYICQMQDFYEKIRLRLQQELPGERAHQQMVPTLSSGQRIKFKYETPAKKGAVLILLYEDEGVLKFPLIQRPVYDGVHSGQVALPGGKFEPGDADLFYTALRETQEEIGVPLSQIQVLGALSEFMVSASNHLVLPVIGYIKAVPQFIPDKQEVEEVFSAEITSLILKESIKSKIIQTNHGHSLMAPYFDIQGRVVWGATAMMLSEFVTIIHEL